MRVVWTKSKDNKLADLASRDRAAFLKLAVFDSGAPVEVIVTEGLFATALKGSSAKIWDWSWTETVLAVAPAC